MNLLVKQFEKIVPGNKKMGFADLMFCPLKLNPMKKNYSNQFIGGLFILCLIAVACKAREQKAELKMAQKQFQNEEKKTIPVFGKKDTCIVEIGKPEILAYCLSKAELDSLPASEKDDFNESYSDFAYYWDEYAEHPGKMMVNETGARFIHIGDSTIDRKSLPNNGFGIILISKSGHFKIIGGIFDKVEIERNSKFFDL